jgi:hypothetical protein
MEWERVIRATVHYHCREIRINGKNLDDEQEKEFADYVIGEPPFPELPSTRTDRFNLMDRIEDKMEEYEKLKGLERY